MKCYNELSDSVTSHGLCIWDQPHVILCLIPASGVPRAYDLLYMI